MTDSNDEREHDAKRFDILIEALKKENEEQAEQIAALTKKNNCLDADIRRMKSDFARMEQMIIDTVNGGRRLDWPDKRWRKNIPHGPQWDL